MLHCSNRVQALLVLYAGLSSRPTGRPKRTSQPPDRFTVVRGGAHGKKGIPKVEPPPSSAVPPRMVSQQRWPAAAVSRPSTGETAAAAAALMSIPCADPAGLPRQSIPAASTAGQPSHLGNHELLARLDKAEAALSAASIDAKRVDAEVQTIQQALLSLQQAKLRTDFQLRAAQLELQHVRQSSTSIPQAP